MKLKLQRDYRDCGISCLFYIINYYKGFVPYETLRIDTFTNQDGVSAYHLVETLKKYGFQAVGKKINYYNLNNITMPFIAHVVLENGLEHFIVIIKIKNNNIYVMDPAVGNKKLIKKDFLKIWDGIIIECIPIKCIVKMPKENMFIKYIKSNYYTFKKSIIVLVIMQLITIGIHIIFAYYVSICMAVNSLNIIIVIFILLFLLQLILSYLIGHIKIKIENSVLKTTLKDFIRHMSLVPLKNILSYTGGELLTRIEEVRELKSTLSSIIIPILLETILCIISFAMLLFVNQRMGIILIVSMFIYLLFSLLQGQKVYKVAMRSIEEEMNFKEQMLETINFLPTIKHLNNYNYNYQKTFTNIDNNVVIKEKEEKYFFLIEYLRSNYLELLFLCLTTIGVISIKNNSLEMLDFIVFQSLYIYLISPLKEIADIIPRWYYYTKIVDKVSDFLLIEEEKNNYKELTKCSITFKNVSFSYQNIYPVLNNTSFVIKEGEHIILKGPSGSGKSTICKLIIKEIDNYKGTILIGKTLLTEYEPIDLRNHITYLSQNESIISTTIKENIILGRKISENEFSKVCKICQIDKIVSKKKYGYDSIINPNSISGGESQRIILARTLLNNSNVYLLDECLSEIDNKNSLDIIMKIHDYLKGKTLLFISHQDIKISLDKTINLDMKGGDSYAE